MTGDVIIMAAPNGSRWSKADHPALPITIDEITQEAVRCHKAGAAIIHAHVRDEDGAHVLDVGLYHELIDEIELKCPGLLVQITTEAVGRYTPQQQRFVVCSIKPEMVSVALKEMIPTREDEQVAGKFYAWAAEAGVHVQHILYSAEDVQYYRILRARGVIPPFPTGALFVLGRYSENLLAVPEELIPLHNAAGDMVNHWFCCAFGQNEAACMKLGMERGGHPRVGFENNFLLEDGSSAKGTYELVEQTVKAAESLGRKTGTIEYARQALWHRVQRN